MRRQSGCLRRGALAAIFVLRAGTAYGEGASPPIDIFVAGDADALTQLKRGIGVPEHPIHWVQIPAVDPSEVIRRPPVGGEGRAPRVWIDWSTPERVRMYFANADGERFLVREVLFPEGFGELGLETVAQVIQSSLSALVLSAESGISRAEMTAVLAPLPPPATLPPPLPEWRFSGGAFYALQAFAPERPVDQGPGLCVAFGQREGRWRLAGWISGQYQLPETISADLIGVRLDTVRLRAGAELGRSLTPHVILAMGLGAGEDIVHIAPRQSGAVAATLSHDRFSWAYAARVQVALSLRAAPSMDISAALTTDFDLSMLHYDVLVDGSTVRVFTPWWVRPGVMAGVTWR
jgi:hypothetical protein